jgi:hypothetical protein
LKCRQYFVDDLLLEEPSDELQSFANGDFNSETIILDDNESGLHEDICEIIKRTRGQSAKFPWYRRRDVSSGKPVHSGPNFKIRTTVSAD